ncbi:MAG: hypothetical protein ACTSRG_17130 [Candidatus Helarchaeota archaeon]
MSEVKPGLSAKEVAILHYKLLMEDNHEEWLKTIRKLIRHNVAHWWKTGRKYVEKNGWSYKFRHEDDRPAFHTDDKRKFFFWRFNAKGEEQGMPVPIKLIKDPDDNNEWRVDVSSW